MKKRNAFSIFIFSIFIFFSGFSQPKFNKDTLSMIVKKNQVKNDFTFTKMQAENKKNLKHIKDLTSRADLIEKKLIKLEEKPLINDILKALFYLATVFTTLLLASFGLSEDLVDVYFDGIYRKKRSYKFETNEINTRNFYLTIFGIIFTCLVTTIQLCLDTKRIWLVIAYILLIIFGVYFYLNFHNKVLEQSYIDKWNIGLKSIKRYFFWIFRRKYCEVCLTKCEKNDVKIKYLKNTENRTIEMVRFGHETCLEEVFKEYEPSGGGSKEYEYFEIGLNESNTDTSIFKNDRSSLEKIKIKINKIGKLF